MVLFRPARRLVALVLGFAVTASLAGMTTAVATTFLPGSPGIGDPYVPEEGNGGYQVLRYDLDVKYDPSTGTLDGVATIKARATQDLSTFNFDLYGLTVTAATVDAMPATATRSAPHELSLEPASGIVAGSTFTSVVEYGGTPDLYHDPDLGASGWFVTRDGAIVVGEPEAGMFWFPVNEHPSDKARLCVDATVPKGLRAVSNGLPVGPPRTKAGWTTWSWCARDPMASYLATLAIGTWRVDRSTSDDGVPVLNFVDRDLPKRVDRTLARGGEIVDYFARRFGPYPFEAAGGIADDHPSDYALENQTRPTYDKGTARWSGLESVVAHELAHQWFGDSVALERWRHIWLNEGFATYAEWMWVAHAGGPTVEDRFDRLYARAADRPFWRTRVANPGYPKMFSGPVYYRGAMALQAIRLTVGSDDFWKIMRSWARVHQGGNVGTRDFERLAERMSGQQLDTVFREWLVDGDKPPDPR